MSRVPVAGRLVSRLALVKDGSPMSGAIATADELKRSGSATRFAWLRVYWRVHASPSALTRSIRTVAECRPRGADPCAYRHSMHGEPSSMPIASAIPSRVALQPAARLSLSSRLPPCRVIVTRYSPAGAAGPISARTQILAVARCSRVLRAFVAQCSRRLATLTMRTGSVHSQACSTVTPGPSRYTHSTVAPPHAGPNSP